MIQNEDGSYREYTHIVEDNTHKDRLISSYSSLEEKTGILTGIACLISGFVFHLGFLELLTVNKFDAAFSKIIFYCECILTKKLDESFINENSFEILSLGFGLLMFQQASYLVSDYIEEKIKEIRKLNFKTVISELVIVLLILVIMRFAYPLLITGLSKISEAFNFEITQFILAEGIICIAFSIFHLKYIIEPTFEVCYPKNSKKFCDPMSTFNRC